MVKRIKGCVNIGVEVVGVDLDVLALILAPRLHFDGWANIHGDPKKEAGTEAPAVIISREAERDAQA